jgi:prolyl-tRNA synthetase
VDSGNVMTARRDIPGRDGKQILPQANAAAWAAELLETIQQSMYDRAVKFRDDHIFSPQTHEEFLQALDQGWAHVWWCEDAACEAEIKEETKATTRCIPMGQPEGEDGVCIHCGKPARRKVYISRAY